MSSARFRIFKGRKTARERRRIPHAFYLPITLPAAVGAFTITGSASTYSLLENAFGTSYLVAGSPVVTFGAGSYLVTGGTSTYTKDNVNWFKITPPTTTWTLEG